MIVYLAGKITGNPGYREDFKAARELIQETVLHDAAVLDPTTLPGGMKPADYMRICLAMIDTADAVVLLPTYRDSRGAMIEKTYAEYIGKAVLELLPDGTSRIISQNRHLPEAT